MSQGFEDFLSRSLDDLSKRNLRRSLRVVASPQGAHVDLDGRQYLNFSSNDYLGLAGHPLLAQAARNELDGAGYGSGASRLITGTMVAHEKLEAALAEFKGTEAALCFSSGYAAALGTIAAICGSGDVVILDKLSHACLVDGARLSGADVRVFPHNNVQKLRSHLAWAGRERPGARILVVTESVFSMDGDTAPLAEIISAKDEAGAWLLLDEAHAVGVLGPGGRGLAEIDGLAARVEIQMGTLGKALGSHGAYIAGSHRLRDYLLNRARSFIFSTAPPPSNAAAAAAAIGIVAGHEGEQLRKRLWNNLESLGKRIGRTPTSAIMPVIVGGEADALAVARQFQDLGILAPAIRYPTVAKGTARLRLTISSAHNANDIETLAAAMERFGLTAKTGLDGLEADK